MKNNIDVLFVSFSDTEGGAARATYRLMSSLREQGVNVKLLVLEKNSDDCDVITLDSNFLIFITRLVSFLETKLWNFIFRPKEHFSFQFLPSLFFRRKIIKINPKVVHLHWISRGVLSVGDIAKLNKKVFITLHDNNMFTAGCHVKMSCEQYASNCLNCPKITRSKAMLSHYFNYKKSKLLQSDIHWVCISSWVKNELLKSEVYSIKNHETSIVTNPLNVNIFTPFSKELLKCMFNISGKKVLVFSALSINNYNKGFDLLLDSLEILKKSYMQTEIVLFIIGKVDKIPESFFEIIALGKLSDEISLNLYYSLADLMIVPSRQETLCQSATEALACGTPVVGFIDTGLTEVIIHKVNGFLADFESVESLSDGIKFCLSDENMLSLSEKSREVAVEKFSQGTIANKTVKMYKL